MPRREDPASTTPVGLDTHDPLPSSAPLRESGAFPVVGIGASAGGLKACTELVSVLPADTGMAFILVQHLDPTHESMMADLLAGHTPMPVLQAIDGMPIERDHIYVIPPGAYLSVGSGALHLSEPKARRGARLPFDFLLHSLAEACGSRSICVILSGTGADGSVGAKVIKENGGLVIAQDPDEAEYDGMPTSAITAGAVDLVLPVDQIPDALANAARTPARVGNSPTSGDSAIDALPEIIDLLRKNTAHDFTLYKMGTLRRRIERRMGLASIEPKGMVRYLDLLKRDPGELDLLANDLLINVTSFFRDPDVFDLLAKTVIPQLVRDHPSDRPLRIWIAGCSTGEETYSIAMLFREAITAADRPIKLQLFGSDVDPLAVAIARDGLYPEAIATDVSPERLARFFSKEDHSYRILPDLRATIVFTVQDVLADPPFSRLDFVSCRNLLIYLGADAQAKVIALFNFALRPGGILLLGNAETVGTIEGRFEAISKPERLYRHIGRSHPSDFHFSPSGSARIPARPERDPVPAPPLAEFCRRLTVEAYVPAVVLIDRKFDCLYLQGPTDRYLRVAAGYPTHNLLAMATPALRARLRSAIERTSRTNAHVVVPGGRTILDGCSSAFDIDVRSVLNEGVELLLIGFIDTPNPTPKTDRKSAERDPLRFADLEHELDVTRAELQAAIHDLEVSDEKHRALDEEALSVNEEYQSINEELLTSKEEMQSLNEELTALNSQLQETLERQRTTSSDLQNILFSTDVATLFLDRDLNIRFFTPATKALFNLIPGDVSRPLADLTSLAADASLPGGARSVLHNRTPIECEIETADGKWFLRKILPYRTHNDGVEGVVVTFADITERKRTRRALEAATRQVEQANVAKSRFLAAASHDLRQPLQSLAILHGLLVRAIKGKRAKQLFARLERVLVTMAGMLNTMLDINQIEAGVVRVEPTDFPVNDLLERMRAEFTDQANAQKLRFHMVECGLEVHSDANLLDQMVRNLVGNALKYTKRGKVLLGCRRRAGMLRIEIWDTGIGIPGAELDAIFDEYHQVGNDARERSRGLGLGLSIVKRLGELLDHHVGVRSQPAKGSVFFIEVPLAREQRPRSGGQRLAEQSAAVEPACKTGTILVVEDDPEMRELLELLLTGDGHSVIAASDGPAALKLVARLPVQPDLVLADYNLPNWMHGLQLTAQLQEQLRCQLPVIILTGDISTATLRDIASQGCVQLNKPVKSVELTRAIQRLLPFSATIEQTQEHPVAEALEGGGSPTIFIVDDDKAVRDAFRDLLEETGQTVEDYADCETFLATYRPGGETCLLLDAYLPGMKGIELLQQLRAADHWLPVIMITGSSDVAMAVEAMKAGACDFIEKPVSPQELIVSVGRALELSRDASKLTVWRETAANRIARLTRRQRQVMDLVLAGHPSKNIAADLGISQRTVENHRATIMRKTGAKSLPALARLALAAAS